MFKIHNCGEGPNFIIQIMLDTIMEKEGSDGSKITSDYNRNLLQSSSVALNFCILVYKRIWALYKGILFIHTYRITELKIVQDFSIWLLLLLALLWELLCWLWGWWGVRVNPDLVHQGGEGGSELSGMGGCDCQGWRAQKAEAQSLKRQLDLLLQSWTSSSPKKRVGAEAASGCFGRVEWLDRIIINWNLNNVAEEICALMACSWEYWCFKTLKSLS